MKWLSLKQMLTDTLILLAICFLIGVVTHVSAEEFNLSANISENDILWSFDDGFTYTVNVDGNITNNYEGNFWLLQNLEPNSRHYIILSSGIVSVTQWITTKQNFYQTNYFYILILTLAFLAVSIGVALISAGAFVTSFLLLFETVTQYQDDTNFYFYFVVGIILLIVSGARMVSKYNEG